MEVAQANSLACLLAIPNELNLLRLLPVIGRDVTAPHEPPEFAVLHVHHLVTSYAIEHPGVCLQFGNVGELVADLAVEFFEDCLPATLFQGFLQITQFFPKKLAAEKTRKNQRQDNGDNSKYDENECIHQRVLSDLRLL